MARWVEEGAQMSRCAHHQAGDGSAPDLVPLVATLVAALEGTLLAARCLFGALDAADGRHATVMAHPGAFPARHPPAPCRVCHRPHPGPRAGVAAACPDRLTRRELEVLRLVADGLSNRQVAQALFLSPRTVQRHVANAYLKIDAHNKAEATAYVLRHDLA